MFLSFASMRAMSDQISWPAWSSTSSTSSNDLAQDSPRSWKRRGQVAGAKLQSETAETGLAEETCETETDAANVSWLYLDQKQCRESLWGGDLLQSCEKLRAALMFR